MLSVLSVCRVFPQDRLAGAHELNALKPCSLDQPTGCIHPRDGSLEDSLKSFFFSFLQSLSLPLIRPGAQANKMSYSSSSQEHLNPLLRWE